VLRSAEDPAPPREAPPDRKTQVPQQVLGAIDRIAAAQSIDDTGSVATEDMQAQGRIRVHHPSDMNMNAGARGKAALTSLNLHAIKKREPNGRSSNNDNVGPDGVNNDMIVGSSPVRRPMGLPPLSAYGQKPMLAEDGTKILEPYAAKKRRRVPWPGEYEYVSIYVVVTEVLDDG
jgi:hypothetical protein